jgi:chromosome partitioning protein
MTKIIGIAQLKGGTGRSTLACNLAGELAKIGTTVLIDCDVPQGTSSSWAALRADGVPNSSLQTETAASHRELVEKLQQHQGAQFIVLDGPPRLAELTRAMVILSDLCLIPVGATPADVWATGDILELVKEARKVKRGLKVRVVWSRHRGHLKLAQQLTSQATEQLSLDPLNTALSYRVAYAEALGYGLTAAETSDREARQEVQSLVKEVIDLLERKA